MNDGSGTHRVLILMVEDNATDVMLTGEALRDCGIAHEMHVAEDGIEALEFLRREGRYVEAARPDLILLDLNLPRMGGHALLEQIKTDPGLKEIPVVVLTTSRRDADVNNAYALHANCYVFKPFGFDAFADAIRSIERFWLQVARLPLGSVHGR
ncbi:MAG: response regulator [Thermoanaerobaculia bacterium]